MHEAPFAARDAFGLTADDWLSFAGFSLETYSGPALLWYALAGAPLDKGGNVMSGYPFSDLLTSLAADACALATLASSSRDDDVRALSASLRNLHRRIETAAEIAQRMKEDPPPETH